MTPWHDIQRAFAAAVRLGDDAGLQPRIRPDGMRAESRIAVYRNNYRSNLTGLLTQRFGVVRDLVGDDFFAALWERFIAAHPPLVACLDRYGGDFPGFAARFPPLADYPTVGAMAALEWRLFAVQRAPAPSPLPLTALQGIAPAQAMGLRLRITPQAAYLAADVPLAALWQAVRTGNPPPLMDGGQEWLEIRAEATDWRITRLNPAEFSFRAALAHGAPLATALEQALALEPGFAFAASLAALFSEGSIIKIEAMNDADDHKPGP